MATCRFPPFFSLCSKSRGARAAALGCASPFQGESRGGRAVAWRPGLRPHDNTRPTRLRLANGRAYVAAPPPGRCPGPGLRPHPNAAATRFARRRRPLMGWLPRARLVGRAGCAPPRSLRDLAAPALVASPSSRGFSSRTCAMPGAQMREGIFDAWCISCISYLYHVSYQYHYEIHNTKYRRDTDGTRRNYV